MAVNEKSKENLQPAQPGEVRNPKGRGKGVKNRATILRGLLGLKQNIKHPLKEGKKARVTVEEAVELALINKALKGDVRAIELISEKMYGKIPQDVNLGGQSDNPIVEEKKLKGLSFEELYELKYGKPYEAPEYKGDKNDG